MNNKEFGSFYKKVGGNEGTKCHYPSRLDTYGCGCQHNCSYCVDPDTQVLMYDGTVKPIKNIQIGDEIYGVESGETYKRFTKSVVLNRFSKVDKSYKITLSNGNSLICSGNHQWLSDRGWKYTTGKECGKDRRPFLTTNNSLMGFNSLYDIPDYPVSEDYMKGYLRGVILGDANLKEYHYSREYRQNDNQYHFRLALKEERITGRSKAYLKYFGVDTNTFEFPMKDRKTKENYVVTAIRTNKKENYDKIWNIILPVESAEFKRGFLAGIYDAEGSNDILIRRIYNSDDGIIEETTSYLGYFGFTYTFDKESRAKNVTLKTIRILGGVSESLRFNIVTDCIKTNGEGSIQSLALKSANKDDLKIVSIEEYKEEQELIDITTTTRNFIANGVVSHNCYAKSLLEFRKLWDWENPAIADINKIRKTVKKLHSDGVEVIRLGGMTDCFQPLEKTHRVTYETIKALNEARVEYLIVTKSAIVADSEYLEILDKDLAHIQITITCFDDDLYRKLDYEKASLPSDRIRAVETLEKLGFDVSVRLSPFIKEFVDFNVLNNIKCKKILVEFLRVNSWIKKWFDIDYSQHTVKEGGYLHLPLEVKKEYIKLITGFEEVSVCEDESEAYEYWNLHFNPNPNDCCNLRGEHKNTVNFHPVRSEKKEDLF